MEMEMEMEMSIYRKNAIIVGALFIMTTIAGIIEANFISPILQGTLDQVYPNEILVKTGALLIFGMSIGIVGIAIALFPVLRKHNATIAITYLSFRSIECVLLVIGSVVSLFLITLSQKYIIAGAPDASYFQTLSALALTVRYSAYQFAMIILGLGSLMVFYVFYRSKLIPRWLSFLGIIGYALLFVSALLDVFGMIDTVRGSGALLYIPGGLFELIALPLWLFLKGFNSSTNAAVIPT